MGSGQKRWAEELEDERYQQSLARFQSKSPYQVLEAIQKCLNELRLFESSAPGLTRIQWSRIDTCISELKNLV